MSYSLDLHEAMFPITPFDVEIADDRPHRPDARCGAMAELSEVYRQWGYQSGYTQATRDHLALFVANAEDVLASREGTWAERDAARRLLYGFIARL